LSPRFTTVGSSLVNGESDYQDADLGEQKDPAQLECLHSVV
jgi:hypothetical protein